MGPELDLDELVKYPRGSLGYIYAKVLKHLGGYIVTHFSMIGPGELGVIAITELQYGYPAFMTLDLGAIALSMMRVEGWDQHVGWVRRGWEMAEPIKPLMGVRWEDGLDKPVDVWRKELDIEPIRQGQNSWYEVLAGLEF